MRPPCYDSESTAVSPFPSRPNLRTATALRFLLSSTCLRTLVRCIRLVYSLRYPVKPRTRPSSADKRDLTPVQESADDQTTIRVVTILRRHTKACWERTRRMTRMTERNGQGRCPILWKHSDRKRIGRSKNLRWLAGSVTQVVSFSQTLL